MIACVLAMAISAQAISINDPGVVGTIRSGEPAGPDDEVAYVNNLLGLGANATATIAGHDYATSSTDYNGTVSGGVQDTTGNLVVPTGYQYVLAKYDGPNGGDVLWYLNGAGITLPADSSPLWLNTAEKGYGISHFTVYGETPPSVPDGGMTLALLGFVLVGAEGMRRRKIQ